MDTKLKKFNRNMLVRSLAFLMCTMMFTAAIVSGIAAVVNIESSGRSFDLNDIRYTRDYLESSELQSEFQNQTYELVNVISEYKSEEYIKSGKFLNLNQGELGDAISELYHNGTYYNGYEEIIANETNFAEAGEFSSENGQVYYAETADFGDQRVRNAFIAANKEQIEQIKQTLIKTQLRDFNRAKETLNAKAGMKYLVSDGTETITNAQAGAEAKASDFKKNPAFLIYENGKMEKEPRDTHNRSSWDYDYDYDYAIEERLFGINDNLKVYLAYNKNFIAEKQLAYENVDGILGTLIISLLFGLGSLILFLYLVITTGARDQEGNRKLYTIDRLWTELQLMVVASATTVGVWLCAGLIYMPYGYQNADRQGEIEQIYRAMVSVEGIALSVACFITACIGLWFTLSLIRLLKAKAFITHSLTYKLWNLVIHKWCGKLWASIKDIFNGSSLMKKIVICTLGICLISATIFLAPIAFLVIVVFAPKWVKRFEEIKIGLEEVKNGNLTHKIPVNGNGELDQLAESINEISAASSIAVQNELKNQRLKTELISNVSHDLKTPLTSMVTYIDLLKTEGLHSENAEEYLRILDEKTERLRHLTEDLFEAAKASSGAMPVHMGKVELLSLINQGLGEMDNKIKASGLEFIINAEKDKYFVLADGQLLWRVVENLLGNVLKYAMESSRVYIDIKEIGNKKDSVSGVVTLEMKNISRNPLNINAEELMERFKRGDESRTTEGSGLGLAIAKDLVKLQDGWFEVFIDGDLFKAQVMLTKFKESEEDTKKEPEISLKKEGEA